MVCAWPNAHRMTGHSPDVLYMTPGCFDKGGVSRYSRYQISALREILGQHAVRVYSLLGPGEDSFEESFAADFAAGGNSEYDRFRYLAKVLRDGLSRAPDLIFAAQDRKSVV